jgi:hypothetical protein
MSFMQLFLSSFRLLLLQVDTAEEVVPPEDRQAFNIFVVGAVAAPVVHVRDEHNGNTFCGDVPVCGLRLASLTSKLISHATVCSLCYAMISVVLALLFNQAVQPTAPYKCVPLAHASHAFLSVPCLHCG